MDSPSWKGKSVEEEGDFPGRPRLGGDEQAVQAIAVDVGGLGIYDHR